MDMTLVKLPEAKPKRAYRHSPEVAEAIKFNARVKKLKALAKSRSRLVKALDKAKIRLDRQERALTRAKKAFVKMF